MATHLYSTNSSIVAVDEHGKTKWQMTFEEVAQLRAALADARKVIEPFRKFVRVFENTTAKTHDNSHTLAYADVNGDTSLTLGDLRAAAEWLAEHGGE